MADPIFMLHDNGFEMEVTFDKLNKEDVSPEFLRQMAANHERNFDIS